MIVASNHASHLDPVLVGSATERRLTFLARSTLFEPRFFGALIRALGAVPIEREGVGIGGLRAALTVLGQGGAVLVFPEGTRSRDGELGSFRTGAVRIAQRSGAPIVPVWVEGSRRAMPRGARFPRPRAIEVRVGTPFRVDPRADLDVATASLRARIAALAEGGHARNEIETLVVEATGTKVQTTGPRSAAGAR